MKPLVVETGTSTHLPLMRGGLSGRIAAPWLFTVLCLISSLSVFTVWFAAGNTTGTAGQTSTALVSVTEYETASATTLSAFVDHLLDRPSAHQKGDENPATVTEQPGGVS